MPPLRILSRYMLTKWCTTDLSKRLEGIYDACQTSNLEPNF